MVLFSNNYCSVCENHKTRFLPLPKFYEKNSKKYGFKYFNDMEMTHKKKYNCRICGASDRERLYAYYIKNTFNGKENITFYHFAPEKALSRMIREYLKKINYTTIDLLSNDVDINADLTKLDRIKDNSCDFFICSHVLEHIQDDITAMKELFRITKDNGKGILMVPIATSLCRSIENIEEVRTDEDRWKYYGQNDHVRVYSKSDFLERIKKTGFKVEILDMNFFGEKIYKKMGLKKTSVLYVVKKE